MLQIEILKLDDRYLEIKARGDTYTLFSPLVEYLSNDPDVEYVQFDVDHPLQENVYFKIKMKRGNPLDAVQRAVNAILSDLEELEKSFFS
ncbi:DNA-directed RNA polymerase subunit L [Pyrobaculum ferrireducens]|uniref:DNA-directed RNA polymerase subunit Rpo11 n=1 Tax=Pyrobaculum ferrireducens TaxID=1104324 RepID=G7VF64_9CREN|nr:DNA-directed RNA polymerase subunit L [Pyrobaculum ferrireducens]AET31680.1 DNA-directed RNA polymerase subunit L (rpoL) [Pyrobaculum ferrireducens]